MPRNKKAERDSFLDLPGSRKRKKNNNPVGSDTAPGGDFDDISSTSGAPDDLASGSAEPPQPTSPTEGSSQSQPVQGGDQPAQSTGESQAAAQHLVYPEKGAFFEVPPANNPDAKEGWTIQRYYDFLDNAQQFMDKSGISGSVEDYARGCISSGHIRVVVKYLDRDGLPVNEPAVPEEAADSHLRDFYRQLEEVQPVPQAAPVNHLFASVDPENFDAEYDKLTDAQKAAAAASFKQVLQVAWQNPVSATASQEPPAEDPPKSDPPTQP